MAGGAGPSPGGIRLSAKIASSRTRGWAPGQLGGAGGGVGRAKTRHSWGTLGALPAGRHCKPGCPNFIRRGGPRLRVLDSGDLNATRINALGLQEWLAGGATQLDGAPKCRAHGPACLCSNPDFLKGQQIRASRGGNMRWRDVIIGTKFPNQDKTGPGEQRKCRFRPPQSGKE